VPGKLEECSHDTLETLEFLEKEGVSKAGILGWSFGGAVVCQAAGRSKSGSVKAIVTMATQSRGIGPIEDAKGVASLFLHGTVDKCLPTKCSKKAYELAKEPKELKLVKDHHGFFDVAEEVEGDVFGWFTKYLV